MGPEGPIELGIRGPRRRPDLPGLYARTCALLTERPGARVRLDVTNLPADAVAVEALATLRLAAQRGGHGVVLVGASPAMRAIVDLVGLAEVLPAELAVEPGR
jgi:anti-anti-sigma regulatory factor